MPGYTDYDPFGASPLSPSASAIRPEPAAPPPAPTPSPSPSFEAVDSTDTLAWLSSLTQGGTMDYDVLSSTPTLLILRQMPVYLTSLPQSMPTPIAVLPISSA